MRIQIPGLNGLRAIAIILVLFGHARFLNHRFANPIFHKMPILFSGRLGVIIFFVISGFLITALLLEEEKTKNLVSLKNFYLRRTFRILPVYYTLLLFYFILQVAGIIHLTGASWLTSLTFTKSFYWKSDWETAHLWSISIEEMFYLIWPLVFKFSRNHRNKFVFFIILIVPIIRLITHHLYGDHVNENSIFQRADSLMWGCLFAVYRSGPDFVNQSHKI